VPERAQTPPGRQRCHSLAAVVTTLALVGAAGRPATAGAPARQLVVRCDDVGMCHAVNLAVAKLIATGIPISTSVMFACPWYREAVALLAQHPEVAVGVHLTLNAEWEHYRWGPVVGRSKAPALVDAEGFFLPTEEAFAARAPDLGEIEAELRAQIERASATGLRIDYLDAHMQTAFSTAELRAMVMRLARDYGLGVSPYFGERSATLWDAAPEAKLGTLLRLLREAGDGLTLLVVHPGLDDAEMTALVDMNNPADPFRVGRHRQAELDAVASASFRDAVGAAGLTLVTYRQVIEQHGLAAMVPPRQGSGYSMEPAPR
jgi:predicted glycoside hydrolase/deacetylase ChbG (UPF0249 family)